MVPKYAPDVGYRCKTLLTKILAFTQIFGSFLILVGENTSNDFKPYQTKAIFTFLEMNSNDKANYLTHAFNKLSPVI
eukprot:jgi/Bigna1/133140/aug1.20_g7848